MRRAVQKEIQDLLSEEILKGKFKGSSKIKVILEGDTPSFIDVEDTVSLLSSAN
jgi:ATP-dependent Clp protease ATP-binding subunit ClpC